MSDSGKLLSLFGEFTPLQGFQPLVTLSECEEEKLEPLIENLIYENEYILLTGVKDTLKSWLAGYMAVCVSLGKPCFDRKVKQGKVVYVYGEGAMKKRLRLLGRAMGCEENPNLYPYPLRADLSTEKAILDFCHHIPPETKLIIIDNYEKYWFSDMDDKIIASAVSLMAKIRDHATVVLIQHEVKHQWKGANKHALAKGSTRIINPADGTLSLQKNKGVVNCEIYHRESDSFPPLKFKLKKLADGLFTLELVNLSPYDMAFASIEEEEEKCLSQIRPILQVGMKEPLNKTAIYTNCLKGKGIKGLSTESFYSRYFDKLVSEGFLKEQEAGNGKYVLVG